MRGFGGEIWADVVAGANGNGGLSAFVRGELSGAAELHDTIREARG